MGLKSFYSGLTNFKTKYVSSGIEVIRNKTGFETAVHQLILVQIAPIPDDIPSPN